MHRTILFTLFLFLVSNATLSQETTGKLEGRILDSGRNPIVSANILINSNSMQGERGTTTNEKGYFYAFNLHDGWQINASPVFSYNHKADSDNKLTFPVGLGVSKTTVFNGRPWKFGVQFWHYVASPDLYGPDWQIRLNITPVVALPW